MKVFTAILLSLSLFCGCIREDRVGANVEVGDKLPDFEVIMSDGSVVSNNSLEGNISLVMFFHTSCPDCQQALPRVQDIYNEYTQKGVYFVLIGRECGKDEIEAYWSENGLNMPYSAQENRHVYNKFASTRIPRVYICDKDGIIRYIFTDDPIPAYDDLISSLESLIR